MADETVTEDPSTDAPETEQPDLGDGGKRALDEERKSRRAAERELKSLQARLAEIEQQSMSATEKAIAEAKAAGRKEALSTANDRLVRAEVRAAAAGKLADPGDAAALLGDLNQYVGDDGEPDTKAISKAIDDLVKSKPYLRAAALNVGDPDAGSRPSSNGSSDMNALIRNAFGRRA